MQRIGILYDILKLKNKDYRSKAFGIFLKSVNPSEIAGCSIYEGETRFALGGKQGIYCIAVEYINKSKIEYVKNLFKNIFDEGLCAIHNRFIEEPQINNEDLLYACHIDTLGGLSNYRFSWIKDVWQQSKSLRKEDNSNYKGLCKRRKN